MKERPILFSAPMVRALLDGSKTQTRRIVKQLDPAAGAVNTNTEGKPMPVCWSYGGPVIHCPYGQPGDRLWVRENHAPVSAGGAKIDSIYFSATPDEMLFLGDDGKFNASPVATNYAGKWRPSIHMPRWASRILLEIVSVRVERLQSISDSDAQAEGTPCHVCGGRMDGKSEDDCHCFHRKSTAIDYRNLWEQINGAGSWDANPWVWVVEFRMIK